MKKRMDAWKIHAERAKYLTMTSVHSYLTTFNKFPHQSTSKDFYLVSAMICPSRSRHFAPDLCVLLCNGARYFPNRDILFPTKVITYSKAVSASRGQSNTWEKVALLPNFDLSLHCCIYTRMLL